MDNQENHSEPFSNLHDRVVKTYTSRFNASRRLRYHERLSLWTISWSSAVLITLPLLKAFDLPLHYSYKMLDLLQMALAIIVLVYSIILHSTNFAVRAERMHDCGLELNALARKILPLIASPPARMTQYHKMLDEYHEILKGKEDHAQTDYWFTQINKFPIEYGVTPWKKILVYLRFLVGYSHYFILLAMELVMIYLGIDWKHVSAS